MGHETPPHGDVVKFRDRDTRGVLRLEHAFDNDLQAAREKSATLVRERVEALNTTLPVILTAIQRSGGHEPGLHEPDTRRLLR